VNKKTGQIEVQHDIAETMGTRVHTQSRRIRMTAQGTILLALLDLGKVVEYDKDFNVVWTYKTPRPWSVVRLRNGNTLIQDEGTRTTSEVSPMGTVVWSVTADQIAGIMPGRFPPQTAERLANGNTAIFVASQSPAINAPQIVEITPEKQPVWILQDWSPTGLGPATSAQFLDQPGIPENPGDLIR
jgi:hypothetical protein